MGTLLRSAIAPAAPQGRAIVILVLIAAWPADCSGAGAGVVEDQVGAGDVAAEAAPDETAGPSDVGPDLPSKDSAVWDAPEAGPIDTGPDLPEALPEPGDAAMDEAPTDAPHLAEVPDILPDATWFPPPIPVGCVTSVAAGDHQFPCDGLSHDLSVPDVCLTSACGVILDIHGLTMSGKQQDNNTNLRALGKQYGYIVVQPNASQPSPLSSWKTGEDDAKVFSFLAAVEIAFHADLKRIHVTGFSQGGLMTWRFICNHADHFASAAPGGSCNYPTQEACLFQGAHMPSRRIPILYMHGKDDVFYLFQAAESQRNAVIAAWDMAPVETLSANAHHEWTRYSGPDGAWLEFVWHDYQADSKMLQGHCYPGSTDSGDEPGQLFSYACVESAAFTWGEIVMDFFLAHPFAEDPNG